MPPNFSLPPQEHQFEIDVIGEKTGERFTGNFVYKRLNLGEARQARCMKARLMDGLVNLDEETVNLCEMFSWLNFGLKKAPPWWGNPEELYDYNIISTVWMEVLDFENGFTSKIKEIGKKKPPKKRKKKETEVEEEVFDGTEEE